MAIRVRRPKDKDDLLDRLVPMPEADPPARLDAIAGQADALGAELVPGRAGLQRIDPVAGGLVRDV